MLPSDCIGCAPLPPGISPVAMLGNERLLQSIPMESHWHHVLTRRGSFSSEFREQAACKSRPFTWLSLPTIVLYIPSRASCSQASSVHVLDCPICLCFPSLSTAGASNLHGLSGHAASATALPSKTGARPSPTHRQTAKLRAVRQVYARSIFYQRCEGSSRRFHLLPLSMGLS